MGIDQPQIFFGKVMHGRLFPKKNIFSYGIYYIALPLSRLGVMSIAYNRFAALGFYDKDHGNCDGSNLESWARKILKDYGQNKPDGEIRLICMPRVLGYVFNPVSFWLCYDKNQSLRAVLCEVHNTFGERHTYLCAHKDQEPIEKTDVLKGQKLFHVSPFLEREGQYTFRFDTGNEHFKTWIDFYDAKGRQKLVTSLIGTLEPLNKATLQKAFWGYPLITLKSVALIHWQALKLLFKGIKYIHKPRQKEQTVSTALDSGGKRLK